MTRSQMTGSQMTAKSNNRSFAAVMLAFVAPLLAQDPAPPAKDKGPDKEVAEKIASLKEVVEDKKFLHDAEGVEMIDKLLIKKEGGVDPKDEQAIVKAFASVLTGGKLRPSSKTELYRGAAAALGKCGPEGAKALREAYSSKRYKETLEWVPLREQLLKYIGRTKDESMIKFLTDEAVRHPEAALQAAAGEALGNFEESKEPLRKEIVGDLIVKYGELAEKASQIGSNIEAQNAQNRLAAIQDKWNATLAKLTGQTLGTFREWQEWYNKNKGKPW